MGILKYMNTADFKQNSCSCHHTWLQIKERVAVCSFASEPLTMDHMKKAFLASFLQASMVYLYELLVRLSWLWHQVNDRWLFVMFEIIHCWWVDWQKLGLVYEMICGMTWCISAHWTSMSNCFFFTDFFESLDQKDFYKPHR